MRAIHNPRLHFYFHFKCLFLGNVFNCDNSARAAKDFLSYFLELSLPFCRVHCWRLSQHWRKRQECRKKLLA